MRRRLLKRKPCGGRQWSQLVHVLRALAWLGALSAASNGLPAGKAREPEGLPRVFLLDAEAIAQARARVAAGDPEPAAPMAKLRQEADDALKVGAFFVMDKPFVPPSGDKHR